jgi:hypothetical protein
MYNKLMTPEELLLAAQLIGRYRDAIESHLYMYMGVPKAHDAIGEAERIEKLLLSEADNAKKSSE